MAVQIVSLAVAKVHLRVTSNAEDALIQLYMDASSEEIEKYLNRRIPGAYLPTPNIPAAISAACLLLVGDLYFNRDGAAAGKATVESNPAVMRLLQPYRDGIGI